MHCPSPKLDSVVFVYPALDHSYGTAVPFLAAARFKSARSRILLQSSTLGLSSAACAQVNSSPLICMFSGFQSRRRGRDRDFWSQLSSNRAAARLPRAFRLGNVFGKNAGRAIRCGREGAQAVRRKAKESEAGAGDGKFSTRNHVTPSDLGAL